MKKLLSNILKIKILKIIIIIILCNSCTNAEKHLPEKYKNYKELEELQNTEKHKIIKLKSVQSPGLYIDSINDYFFLPIVLQTGNKWNRTFFKIDFNGNIIDSLIVDWDKFEVFSRYLLSPNYYNSWLIDGDTTNKKFTNVNEDLKLGEEDFKKKLEELMSQSEMDFYCLGYYEHKNDSNTIINKIDRVYFLIQNEWTCLYGKDFITMELIEKGGNGYIKDYFKPIVMGFNFEKQNNSFFKCDNYELEYFQRNVYVGAGFLPSFHPNGSRASHWSGYGYVNVFLEKDTIKLKRRSVETSPDSHGNLYSYPLDLYKKNKMKCIIFCEDSQIDDMTYIYLIKPF